MQILDINMNIFLYIFPLLILSVSVLFLWRKPKSGFLNTKVPPGSSGWPVVGETIKFLLSGAEQFVGDRRKKHPEDVFRTSLFGKNLVVFGGPQGNKFVFSKILTPWWPESIKKVLAFPGLEETPFSELSAVMLRFVHEVLKPEALKQYVTVMDSMTREHVKSEWDGKEVVKVHPLSQKYTFDLAIRLFVDVVDAEQVARIFKHFTLVTIGLFSIPINLPGTAYHRGIEGGKVVREELVKIITKRRKEMMDKKETSSSSSSDSLSRILLMTDENGKFMSEKMICNNIVGLVLASYDTTSTAVTFVLKYLAELPHIYDEVYKELMEIAKYKKKGESLQWEDLQKMRYTWNVVCESLRLTPPSQGGLREIDAEFSFAGFTIPKGWKASWTVHTTHKDPEYFPDPETFDPSRFEGKGPAPYTFVSFGGGSRICPGKEYARLQILVFLYNIVTRFKLEIINPQEKIQFHSFPVPKEGLPIRIIPHKI